MQLRILFHLTLRQNSVPKRVLFVITTWCPGLCYITTSYIRTLFLTTMFCYHNFLHETRLTVTDFIQILSGYNILKWYHSALLCHPDWSKYNWYHIRNIWFILNQAARHTCGKGSQCCLGMERVFSIEPHFSIYHITHIQCRETLKQALVNLNIDHVAFSCARKENQFRFKQYNPWFLVPVCQWLKKPFNQSISTCKLVSF